MKELIKSVLAVTICAVLIVGINSFRGPIGYTIGADSLDEDEKVVCNATLEHDFAEDAILIVLNKEATHSFREYTSKDFNDIGCIKVEELTKISTQAIKSQIQDPKESLKNDMKFDVESFRRILKLTLAEKGKEKVLNAIKILEKRDDLVSAEPDYAMSVCSTESEGDYDYLRWELDKINLPDAWDITKGLMNVRVGVLDTGIDTSHIDLENRVSVSIYGDFTGLNEDPLEDPLGHGTQVAGIIGAEGIGITGACWYVEMISLRVLNSSGNGYSSYVASAIDFASNPNYDIGILNFSGRWGSGAGNLFYYNTPLDISINNYPGLFVCAAGNENSNNDKNSCYPANYNLSNLITVGATNSNDARATGWANGQASNYGLNSVDIYAPGDNLVSTVTNKSYQYQTGLNGTSLAAPFVAGVAALIKARYGVNADVIKRMILYGADTITIKVPGGFLGLGTTNQSVKRLNAFGALEEKEIYTAQQLSDVRNNPYAHYKLMSNINLSGWNWNAIDCFHGILNGNGKTISNLTINHGTLSADCYNGLFGKNFGEIYWLNMTGVDIGYSIDHGSPYSYVGAIAGKNEHIIHSVTVVGELRVNRRNSAVGGIAGANTGHIGNCTVSIDTWVNGDVGGVAGTNTGYIGGCTVTNSDISHYYVQWNARIGGIVGYCNNGVVNDCTVSASTIQNTGSDGTSSRQPYMGKIVGHILNSELGNLQLSNVDLEPGSLGVNNRQNFGAANWPSFFPSSWAKAAGRESNLVCWW